MLHPAACCRCMLLLHAATGPCRCMLLLFAELCPRGTMWPYWLVRCRTWQHVPPCTLQSLCGMALPACLPPLTHRHLCWPWNRPPTLPKQHSHHVEVQGQALHSGNLTAEHEQADSSSPKQLHPAPSCVLPPRLTGWWQSLVSRVARTSTMAGGWPDRLTVSELTVSMPTVPELTVKLRS